MQTVEIRTTQNVFIEHQLASLGDRLIAAIIDFAILIAYLILIIYILNKVNLHSAWANICIVTIPYISYHLMFEIFMDGQTPGKRQMKIKVVRLDGTPATIANFVMRWMLGIIEIHITQGTLAMICVAMNGKGQRVGDIAAGTTVVKLAARQEVTFEEIFTTADDEHIAQFPSVINLTDYEIELIKQSLEVLERTSNLEPAYAITEKIKEKLGLRSDVPSIDFLRILLKDYSRLTSSN
jgi:uncharacterized RDD family membrane protein YckC